MPGCKTCYDRYHRGEQDYINKATMVAEGTTEAMAETGEGITCDEHAPEGAIDIWLWLEQHGRGS